MARFFLMNIRVAAASALGLWLFVAAGSVVPVVAPARAADPVRFMETIEDLPLMPGLDEDAASGINFDSPGGRIIEVYAAGRVTAAAVAEFYKEVLPQLGWRAEADGLYIRDAESLRVEAVGAAAGGPLSVRFRVQPAKP